MSCRICRAFTPRSMCYFCTRTVAAIRERRCVSCLGPVNDADSAGARVEGRCAECRSRNAQVSGPTRRLLMMASRARYLQGVDVTQADEVGSAQRGPDRFLPRTPGLVTPGVA